MSLWGFTPFVSGWEGGARHLCLERKKSPAAEGNLWLSEFIQHPTRMFYRVQQYNDHRDCQTISRKCPQLENAYVMSRPTEGATHSLAIGRLRWRIIFQRSFITQSTINLTGMCRSQLKTTWPNLTVSQISTISGTSSATVYRKFDCFAALILTGGSRAAPVVHLALIKINCDILNLKKNSNSSTNT